MKSLDKILNSNVSEIGFNKHNNEAYSKLSTIGVTTNSKNFDKFDCDSYISDTNNLKSKKVLVNIFLVKILMLQYKNLTFLLSQILKNQILITLAMKNQ